MKKLLITLAAIVILLGAASFAASFYFFHVAHVREEKSFISHDTIKKTSPLYDDDQSFKALNKETRTLKHDGLVLKAWYIPAKSVSNKTVVLVHGFNNSKANMSTYAMLFYKLGYNLLMPDNRAHGDSEGNIISFGVKDQYDIKAWVEQLAENNPHDDITLFGLSMGAATVMLASDDNLPKQVHNIIEDCGYSSVWDELAFQAKSMYNLPAFPILYEVSALAKYRAGFSYQEDEASSIKSLEHNTIPMLFIHGDKDDFVPTKMVYDNYKADKGPKELVIIKGAGHAKSLETDPKTYQKAVADFLAKHP